MVWWWFSCEDIKVSHSLVQLIFWPAIAIVLELQVLQSCNIPATQGFENWLEVDKPMSMRSLLVLTLFLSGAFAQTKCGSESFEYQSCPRSGAPGDYEPSCLFGSNYRGFHDYFPPNYRILLDTYDYESIYADPNSFSTFYTPVWEATDFDGDFNTVSCCVYYWKWLHMPN